ncbi:hypothetical protein J3459_014895 [Metarhizium acridum]|nr:hypothetical protein J3459_014895 [Metarhizium acridum]
MYCATVTIRLILHCVATLYPESVEISTGGLFNLQPLVSRKGSAFQISVSGRPKRARAEVWHCPFPSVWIVTGIREVADMMMARSSDMVQVNLGDQPQEVVGQGQIDLLDDLEVLSEIDHGAHAQEVLVREVL